MAVCVYKDVSGLFTTEALEIAEKPVEKVPKTPTDAAASLMDTA